MSKRLGPRRESPSAGVGAYGLRLLGLDSARSLLMAAESGWPTLEVTSRIGHSPPGLEWVGPRRAQLCLSGGGCIEIDWPGRRAVITAPRALCHAELVHPHLAPVADLAAHWLGRDSFHAGAVIVDGGAWAIVGDRGAGKSTLLASLALAGHGIVTDDALILDEEGRAFAGPRSIDLREEAARRLGVGEPMGVVGTRERYRLRVGGVPLVPLRGFVLLAWGEATSVTRVPAARRLAALAASRAVRIAPPDPRSLMELSSLPMVELHRRRDWRLAEQAREELLDAIVR